MTNNDLLLRLRYALDILDSDMVKIFALGGIEIKIEDVKKILVKRSGEDRFVITNEPTDFIAVNDKMLDGFLNGFVTFKRGPRDGAPNPLNAKEHPNNLFLKKIKVAMSLTTDDIIAIFKLGEATVSKSELSALLRKPDHKNYRQCLDSSIRRFLKGLAVKYRS